MEAEVVRKVKATLEEHPERTQKSIAEELGVSQCAISFIKAGRYDHLLVRNPPDQIPPELASIVSPEQSFHLVATTPAQMSMAQEHLVKWFRLKVASFDGEISELDAAIEEADKNGWNGKPLKSQRSRAIVRRTFYEKCLLASDAGFCLIPNIPVSAFAIRVKRDSPVETNECTYPIESADSSWNVPRIDDEKCEVLPPSEGRYENPVQLERRSQHIIQDGEKKQVVKYVMASGWQGIEFPMIAARAQVMNETQRAMAMKVFDEIGVSPESHSAKGDPLIIGRIIDRRTYGSPNKVVSFLIAWNVDLRTL